jgi:hypothetical protein
MDGPDIDENLRCRYMRRHDRNAHPTPASPPPDIGRGDDARLHQARLIVTCGRGFRGAFLS